MIESLTTSCRKCPTCYDENAYLINTIDLKLPEDHPFEDKYTALLCASCSTFYCDTTLTDSKLERYYKSLAKYQDKKMGTGGSENPHDVVRFQKLSKFIQEYLPSREIKILDIGCANGGSLVALKKSGYCNLFGIDPSPDCIEEVKKRLDIPALSGSLSIVQNFNEKFDLIILSHVVEHLLSPVDSLSFIKEFLNPNGMLYIEIPDPERFYINETTPFQEFNTEHINHFGREAIGYLVESRGFEKINLHAGTISTPSTLEYPVLIGLWQKVSVVKTQKKFDHDFYLKIRLYNNLSETMMNKISSEIERVSPKKYAIFGAGQFCYKLLALPYFEKNKPLQILDNSSVNVGRILCGITITKPEELKADIEHVIIATMNDPTKIINQLRSISPEVVPLFFNDKCSFREMS